MLIFLSRTSVFLSGWYDVEGEQELSVSLVLLFGALTRRSPGERVTPR